MGIRQAFKSVGQKVKINSEISGRNRLILKEQREIIESYQLMGERIFNLFTQGADVGKNFETDCKQIMGRMNVIREHKVHIERLKGYSSCHKCGKVIKGKGGFCPVCGEKI